MRIRQLSWGLAAAACVATVVGCSGGSGTNNVVPPSGGGSIAFLAEPLVGGQSISAMDGNGANRRAIITRPAGGGAGLLSNFGSPAVSPDGSTLAFGCQEGLCLADSDGTNVRLAVNLANPPASAVALDPDFSPDSRKVVFSGESPQAGSSDVLFIHDIASKQTTQLTMADMAAPGNNAPAHTDASFSPDGTEVVYSRGSAVHIVNVATKQTRLVRTNSEGPDYSPDGARLVMNTDSQSNRVLVTVALDGSDLRTVFSGFAFDPSFSPDGSSIAFAIRVNGVQDIFSARTNGTGLTNLTNTPQVNESSPSWGGRLS